jgi:uncharacterized lipoprotein YehR (DUF1307 family)
MKKKMLSLLLVFTTVFSMVGCGNKDTDSSGTEAQGGDSTYTYTYSSTSPSTWSPTDW